MNLPMLIKLAKSRQMSVTDAVRSALEAGRKYIDSQNIKPQGGTPEATGHCARACDLDWNGE